MKIAIIYSAQHGKLDSAAKALGKTLENGGHHVDYYHIGKSERPPNVGRYDFVYVGSIAEGMFGGKVPSEVSEYLKQCHGFQHCKSAAFMLKGMFHFAHNKGLKKLMGILESMGSPVMDFQTITQSSNAERLGKRLKG
jgi:menaquinone-dependent protoporphyrinogen IX oxidase